MNPVLVRPRPGSSTGAVAFSGAYAAPLAPRSPANSMKSLVEAFRCSSIRRTIASRWKAALARRAFIPSNRPLDGSIPSGPLFTPVGQRRAVDHHAGAGEDLREPVERQRVGIFRDQEPGDESLGGQPSLDQPGGRRRLDDARTPLRAGVARADGLDHPQLGRDDVETFRGSSGKRSPGPFPDPPPPHRSAPSGRSRTDRSGCRARSVPRSAAGPSATSAGRGPLPSSAARGACRSQAPLRPPRRAHPFPRASPSPRRQPVHSPSGSDRWRRDGSFLEAQLKLVGVELLRAGRVPGEAELPDERLQFLQKLLHPGILGGHDRPFRRRSRRISLQRGMLGFQMLAVRPLGREGEGLRLQHRPNLGRQAVQERRTLRKRHAQSLSHDPTTATK